jgi:hypothetical protein
MSDRSSDVIRFTFYGFSAENTAAARREQGKAACSPEAVSLRWLHETIERGQIVMTPLFSYNGVITDDETPHLRCLQQALTEHGQSNLEGMRPESIDPLVSANRQAEPSGHLPVGSKVPLER